MKKITIILSLVIGMHLGLVILPSLVMADDAPNTNVTRRRPDRPANYSPVPSPLTPDVKQVQSSPKPWYTRLWERLVSFFQ